MNKLLRNILGDTNNNQHRPFGQAWIADGTNDTITLAGITNANTMPNKAFSISCLIRNTTSGSLKGARIINDVTLTNLKDFLIFDFCNPFIATNSTALLYARRNSGGIITGYWGTFALINQSLSSKYNHLVITNSGASTLAGIKYYFNGILQTNITNFSDFTPASYSPSDLTYHFCRANNTSVSGNAGAADLFFLQDYAMTPADVRNVYNRLTNVSANYSLYPANVLANRRFHLPLNTPNYDVLGGVTLRALDVSGLNNHGIVNGQGTTPTLVNIY